MRAISIYLLPKAAVIQEALIQAEAQMVFPLGDKGKEYL